MENDFCTLHYTASFDGAVFLGTFSSELMALDVIKECIENDINFFTARNIRLRDIYLSTNVGNVSILEKAELMLKGLKQEFQKTLPSLESYNLFLKNKDYLSLLNQQKKFVITRHKVNEIIYGFKTPGEEFGYSSSNSVTRGSSNNV